MSIDREILNDEDHGIVLESITCDNRDFNTDKFYDINYDIIGELRMLKMKNPNTGFEYNVGYQRCIKFGLKDMARRDETFYVYFFVPIVAVGEEMSENDIQRMMGGLRKHLADQTREYLSGHKNERVTSFVLPMDDKMLEKVNQRLSGKD